MCNGFLSVSAISSFALKKIQSFSVKYKYIILFEKNKVVGWWKDWIFKGEMLALEGEMEQEFDAKLKIQNNSAPNTAQRSKSFAFRAPQENFTIQDFELGKIYGVGSYSKVRFLILFTQFLSLFGVWKQSSFRFLFHFFLFCA